MNKFIRTAAAAALTVIGVTAFSVGSAHANASIDIAFTVGAPTGALPVGATNVPMTITILNNNTPDHVTIPNIICSPTTGAPCPTDPNTGITFIPACKDLVLGAASRCTAGDPDVFELSTTATAKSSLAAPAATSCNGRTFEVFKADAALALYRIFPQDQNPVILAGGETCTLTFSGSVLNAPSSDQDPRVPGVQTGQYAHVDARLDGQNLLASDTNTDQKTITQAQPILKTNALPTAMLGMGTITDTATLTGRIRPTATGVVTFKLYPPNDSTCTGTPVATYAVPIPETASQVTTPAFTPTTIGGYRWVASYSGDRNNLPAAGLCNDTNEISTVTIAKPVLATAASPGVAAQAGTLTDTATLTKNGPLLPESKITFRLYGPDDATCAKPPVFVDADRMFAAGATSVTSAAFTPVTPGVYRWVAQYSGDTNNTGTIGTCGDPLETVTVTKAAPKITSRASGPAVVGVGQLTDVAEVRGAALTSIGGTISFRLYGPNDATCTGAPVFTDLDISFSGSPVTSRAFTPTVAGTYRWVASYSGDANNAAATGVCGDPTETTEVTSPTPPKLPDTGANTTWQALLAGFITVAGVGMLFASQRRTRISR